MRFALSPHLVCLEKASRGLVLSHFGNISIYNSMKPDLSLKILRSLKSSKNLPELKRSLLEFSKVEIDKELRRLLAQNYILRYKDKLNGKAQKANVTLTKLAKSEEALGILTDRVKRAKLAIIDFLNVGDELEQCLRAVGFSEIRTIKNWSGRGQLSGSDACDFFIVLGSAYNGTEFSKFNKLIISLQKPWLPVMLDDFGGSLGPTLGLAGGPCYHCLIQSANRNESLFYKKTSADLILENEEPNQYFSEMLISKSLFSYVAIESVKVISQFLRPMSVEGFYSFDLFNFRMKHTLVYPSPNCIVCRSKKLRRG